MRRLVLTCLFVIPLAACGSEAETINANEFVVEATIADIQNVLTLGQLTCREIVAAYLARIEAYDAPTGLGAIAITNPNALAHAGEIDASLRRGEAMSPLTCAPLLIKDNMDTHDLPTTGGSEVLADNIPPNDAFIIQRLRAAGAIVIAKTNMAEWAFTPWMTVSSSIGTTVNAYDLTRTPAGSSGGTASGVAASFGTAGMGTDTGNSVRGPSSHLGLVGLRPTIGLVSRDGIIPLLADRDVAGPMARTVEDVARILSVIAGPDPSDPYTARATTADYASALHGATLRDKRIGVLRALVPTPTTNTATLALFEQSLQDLENAGAELIDPFEIPGLPAHLAAQIRNEYFCNRFRYDARLYLESVAAPTTDIAEIARTGRHHPSAGAAIRFYANGPLDAPHCPEFAVHPGRQAFAQSVIAAMDAADIDVIVYPTWSDPPPLQTQAQSGYRGDNSQSIAPSTGLPALTVPMGAVDGLPSGLQMLGRPFDEERLLEIAYAYEQATHHRAPPEGFPPLRAE